MDINTTPRGGQVVSHRLVVAVVAVGTALVFAFLGLMVLTQVQHQADRSAAIARQRDVARAVEAAKVAVARANTQRLADADKAAAADVERQVENAQAAAARAVQAEAQRVNDAATEAREAPVRRAKCATEYRALFPSAPAAEATSYCRSA